MNQSDEQLARLDKYIRDSEQARKAIEEAGIVRMFADLAAAEKVPYTREDEGYPPHLLFTRQQWQAYDSWNATWDDLERRYGSQFPEMVGSMQNSFRRIY